MLQRRGPCGSRLGFGGIRLDLAPYSSDAQVDGAGEHLGVHLGANIFVKTARPWDLLTAPSGAKRA
jgi:hypothetical protein